MSAYKSKYRSVKELNQIITLSNEVNIIQAQVFVKILSHIESSLETGNFIIILDDLHRMYQGRLNDLGVGVTTNKSRLKHRLLNYFFCKCQEQPDGKNVLIVFNEGMKNFLKLWLIITIMNQRLLQLHKH